LKKQRTQAEETSCYDNKPDMDQPALSKVVSYQHHQVPQVEAPGTAAAAIPTRTVNQKKFMRTETILMDRPATREDVPIQSLVLIHEMILTFLVNRKQLEVTTKPKRKFPMTVISRIFIEAV
jgi:hypothetical protein